MPFLITADHSQQFVMTSRGITRYNVRLGQKVLYADEVSNFEGHLTEKKM